MKGQATSPGIGIGKVFLYKERNFKIKKKHVEDYNLEVDKFNKALEKAKEEIDGLYNRTLENIGKKEADIFASHNMMLKDPDFIKAIEESIRKDKVNSEWAVKEVANAFIDLFENIEDEYLRARNTDLIDVSNRILRIILNKEKIDLSSIAEESIIVANDLTPSDTADIDRSKVLGLVTELGARTTHTSIIARTLGIPAIVGIDNISKKVKHGDSIIIDGSSGEVFINPTEEEINFYRSKLKTAEKTKEKLKTMIGKEAISKDGYRVDLSGNIGTPLDIDSLLENDGEGVGLFRSEFLYMDSAIIPSEDEQFVAYRQVAIKLGKKPLIIRTLDVGGDKEIPYLNLPKEMNPFLGYRAIRVGLDRPQILKAQLRAIYRASNYGNIKIMFPMISSIEELRRAKEIAKEVRDELKKESIPFSNDVEIGIMVEVPAVAIHARAFAKEVDFFSIGTNDLIQYTLAVDRGNQKIEKLYNQYHPAVLRLIKMIIDGGHQEGIWVGMCGEAAGDEKLIPLFLAMGLDEFSINAGSILRVKEQIRNTSKKEVETHIDTIINLASAEDVENYIEENILKNNR